MHKLILDNFITDQLLQHVSAPQSGGSKSLGVTKPLHCSVSNSLMMASIEGPKHVGVIDQ